MQHQLRPAEDIQSVLGRFQAWSGLSRPGEPRPGVVPGAASPCMVRPVRAAAHLRELSYEEAVAARRKREPGTKASPEQVREVARNVDSHPAPQAGKSAAPRKAKRLARAGAGAAAGSDAPPLTAAKAALRAQPAEASKPVTRGQACDQKSSHAFRHSQANQRRTSRIQPAVSDPACGPVSAPVATPATKIRAAFREVLAAAVELPPGPSAAMPPVKPDAKPLAHFTRERSDKALAAHAGRLSVRISAAEQALIRRRAEESNLSVSAYMRQCALEVEQLRCHVERTLAAMQSARPQQPVAPPVPASSIPASPVLAPTPGFFVRLAQRLLGRGTTALTLRA